MAKKEMAPAIVALYAAADGRIVTVKPTDDAKPVMEVKFGKTDNIIKLAFPLGSEMPTGVLFVGRNGRAYLADVSRYPDAVKGYMVFHGGKQKLGDEYADLDGIDDCFEAMIALDNRLAEGKWDAERKGFAGISVLMKAIMEAFQKTEEEARAFLKDLSPKEKMALKATEELKPIVERMEKERGKDVDTAALLGKLKPQAM